MKIAVIGAGAIGCVMAAKLKQCGQDVFLVGKERSVYSIKENGLLVDGVCGKIDQPVDIFLRMEQQPDLIILAVKMPDIADVIEKNQEIFRNALVVTVQNGVMADKLVAQWVDADKIISTIVMFGATAVSESKVTLNFDGALVVGKPVLEKDEKLISDEKLEKVIEVLTQPFYVVKAGHIGGMKWLKVFVNANNCIPAILGKSMQECFSDMDVCKVSLAIWKEGLRVVERAEIKLDSLPGFEKEKITKIADMPIAKGADFFRNIMKGLSEEPLYGSILQSIKKGKKTEVDYFNGAFVSLAAKLGIGAPLNERLVELVHQVEETNEFLSVEQFLSEVGKVL